ncbi:MAG UNVERIFIED_CONTAM: hypothetical protein LVQ98_00380 [Rickettsiaceae bacterium]|jgi:hypothetical protein
MSASSESKGTIGTIYTIAGLDRLGEGMYVSCTTSREVVLQNNLYVAPQPPLALCYTPMDIETRALGDEALLNTV